MTHSIRYEALDSIVGADRNPKRHAEADIRASVDRFGFVEPIVVDERTGKLLAGHGRVEELRRRRDAGEPAPEGVDVYQGAWTVPVVRGIESKDDQEAEAYLVASNRITEAGGWDEADLASLLISLGDTDLALLGTGYDSDDLSDLLARLDQTPPADPWRDRPLRPMPDPGSFTGGQVWVAGVTG